jgi:hypothetical protein
MGNKNTKKGPAATDLLPILVWEKIKMVTLWRGIEPRSLAFSLMTSEYTNHYTTKD